MTSISAPGTSSLPKVQVSPEAITKGRAALVLGLTMFFAIVAYYFVGVDEGMSSVFGKTMAIHEWMHDARHLLGYPCH